MVMGPRLRKVALTAHVAASVGWLGAALAYLALAVAALSSGSDQMVRSAYLAMEPMAWFAIVPLALAALATGLISSLGTPWGLARHYWVLCKLVLTILAVLIVLGNMRAVDLMARAAAEADVVDAGALRPQILHAAVGAVVLLVITTLGIVKPRGLTRYGRKRHQQGAGPQP